MQRVIIPKAIRRNWIINPETVFKSVYRYDMTRRIFKFCYQPKTRELIFDKQALNHMEIIHAYGKKSFNDYVRGICFWKKRIIYLRGHENEAWLKATEKMLQGCKIAKNIRIIWGKEAAWELREELRGL